MIVHMSRVRIAGPRALLDRTFAALQDAAVLHLVRPPAPPELAAPPPESELAAHLRRILDDVESAMKALGLEAGPQPPPKQAPELKQAARLARRVRRQAERLARDIAALDDERVLLLRYREFFAVFEQLGHALIQPDRHAFYVVLRAGAADAVERLRSSLQAAMGKEVEVLAHPLSSGETAVLLLASSAVAPRVGQLLADSRVQELPAPSSLGETNLLRALPKLERRLTEIPNEIGAKQSEREALRKVHHAWLVELRAWLHDRLLILEAQAQALSGAHLFVIEGWLPERDAPTLSARLTRELGPEVLVEVVATEAWSRADAPVELSNPPLFKPFETITRMLPLPRYGTIDPTPFVAVFFPMFFGIMLGDVGYGAVLALIALVLRRRSQPGSTLRSVASMAGACAAFTVIFGVVFGELFGTLGHAFGMRPLGFNREEAIVPFLGLAVALGVVHVLLGLVLGVMTAWRQGHQRQAMGRSVTALMVVLTALALLAAFEVLPRALFTPFAAAVLIAFPVLIALEGVVAVIELLSTFGHVLSYARIMALGTASLMLAVVANQMVGAMGSVLVGVLFALLFHLVNFAIGLFGPTIHALRLHYVEFFGEFFSPGGSAYRPLSHWRPPQPSR